MNKKLLVEGWRGINHSYAMVNQFQLLQLKQQKIDLYHSDLPFYKKDWNVSQNFCGFDAKAMKEIVSIPIIEDGMIPDVTYRIAFPINLTPAKSDKLFVFGTSEYQTLSDEMLVLQDKSVAFKSLSLTIVTPSTWSKVGFVNAGFHEEQIKIIPHGVDLSIFKTIDLNTRDRYRELLGADKHSFVLLSVGAMTRNKGIDVLLTAYIQLKKKYPQIKLVLKDQSNLYGFLGNDLVLAYFKDKNIDPTSKEIADVISGIVFITDNLSLNQLNGLYNAADCYVSPYRAEGFNLPPLEAAAAGCPIIVTKGGSTDDYIDPSFALTIESEEKYDNGQYYLEPILDSLTDQVSSLIEKKSFDLSVGKAYEFIAHNFSWQEVSKNLLREMGLVTINKSHHEEN